MQRISVNLTNNCGVNQRNYKNDLPAIGNKKYALQKPFNTVIGNAKLPMSFGLSRFEMLKITERIKYIYVYGVFYTLYFLTFRFFDTHPSFVIC